MGKFVKIPIHEPRMKSRRRARKVTTQFHKLTHEIDRLKQNDQVEEEEKKKKIVELKDKIEALGGRKAYQDASILSTSFHRTSKWVFQKLTQFQRRPSKGESKLRLLEVGAINTQLLSCPWLDVTAIDLQSRNEKIKQCDFFTLVPAQEYDVLVSSMVINCVPDAQQRGLMLRHYRSHLRPNGLVFLMLPLLCLSDSKYMTYDRFVAILQTVGFNIVASKESPRIAFFALELAQPKLKLAHQLQLTDLHHKRSDFNVII